MNKVVRAGLLIVVLSLSFAMITQAKTITVHQGESIQAAIDSASPGDTIAVEPGTYTENLTIDKPLILTSTSGSPEGTVIQAQDPNHDLVTVQAPKGEPLIENVTIENLTFQNCNKSGLVFTGSNHRILNNIVKDIKDHGIIPIGGSRVVIAGNTVTGCGKTGIFLWGTSYVTITKNVIKDNNTAITLTAGAEHAEIHYNDIVGSWTFGISSPDHVPANATLNWWGKDIDPTAGWASAEVIVSPFLDGPYPTGLPVYGAEKGKSS